VIRRAALALLLAAGLPGTLWAQSPPPDGEWLTFRTDHFRVTYPPALEPLAREAASVAEGTHEVLARELGDAPSGMIDLVVTDHVDYSNGFARPFPSNRVVVLARPATTDGEFFTRDWLELVVAHEMVHVFHLDRSGLVGRAVRTVLGRVPFVWPVFSVAGTPSWSTEGLATYYETRLTGTGRIRSSFHDMVIRTAALEGDIPALGELSAPSPVWPAGNRSYVYGGRLMRYIADRYGPDAHAEIADATAGAIIPTFLHVDRLARAGTGESFGDLYDQWRAETADSARAVARRVRSSGETPTRVVAGRGPYAVVPRISPDGTLLSFAASDWRSEPATRLADLRSATVRTVGRRNQFGGILSPASWLPDGSGMVLAQLELHGPYRAFSDLWRLDLDGTETRLTDGLRLARPDVAPDGRRVAAVQAHDGGLRLVVHDLDRGTTRVVLDAGPGAAFDAPRWSPDGQRIAASRHAGGRSDLVVVDPATGSAIAITDDDAQDMAPAWSPDGRWLLWWSDRTGIPNIMAAEMGAEGRAGPVMQVTNVVTGVIDPEVAPDGGTLYVAAYHRDGWRIESLPFDPAGWRQAPEPRVGFVVGLLPAPGPPGTAGEVGGAASRYSPLPTLRPYSWLPTYQSVGGDRDDWLRFIGVTVEGQDVLQRHTWALEVAADIHTGRVQGAGQWVYGGLGSPQLYARASRDWARGGRVIFPDSSIEPIVRRDDEVEVGALFLLSRWRSRSSLQVGLEVERQAYEGRNLTSADLDARGVELPTLPTLAGLTASPGFQNFRVHPFSISPEDGISARVGAGRWWVTESGDHGYDEATARATGYLAFPVWGFANHVLVGSAAGLVRAGTAAPARSIGGSGASPVVSAGTDFGASYPVRGFDSGARFGTRAWTASGEWRFPLHLRRPAGSILGFSLVSVSGAVFADAGNAWCTEQDRARPGWDTCPGKGTAPLVAAGAELKVDFGFYHNSPGRLVLGAAHPLQGPGQRPALYVGIGL
jgi:hypothetical protein